MTDVEIPGWTPSDTVRRVVLLVAALNLAYSEASSRESLLHTRTQVERGWLAAAEILERQGQQDLAWYVRRFVDALPPVRTDRELLTQALRRPERKAPQQELTR